MVQCVRHDIGVEGQSELVEDHVQGQLPAMVQQAHHDPSSRTTCLLKIQLPTAYYPQDFHRRHLAISFPYLF
jgi:hypothetical protein